MATTAERNAAFDAVHAHIMKLVPAMFAGYVTTPLVLDIVDDALNAAEKVRQRAAPADHPG